MQEIPSHLISGEAKVAGLIGWPVSHSLSPAIHGFWLAKYGIDGAYVPLAVPPERFEDAVKALPALGFRGFNVTVPYKERILPLLTGMDESAKRLGAVNTVVAAENGALHGSNSDGFGFVENLNEMDPGWEKGVEKAVLLGAGGAARAIAFALHDEGVRHIVVSNRTESRAQDLAAHLARHGVSCAMAPFPPRPGDLEGAGLLVNTTSLGLENGAELDMDFKGLEAGALVADIVYRPSVTAFLQRAEAKGFRTVPGLGMLFHQARHGFELWFGVSPDVTPEMRAAVEAFRIRTEDRS